MMTLELTVGEYVDLCRWYDSLPAHTQALAARFAPGSKWRLRDQTTQWLVAGRVIQPDDWFCPHGITDDGKIRMVQFGALTGVMLFSGFTMLPEDLIPATS